MKKIIEVLQEILEEGPELRSLCVRDSVARMLTDPEDIIGWYIIFEAAVPRWFGFSGDINAPVDASYSEIDLWKGIDGARRKNLVGWLQLYLGKQPDKVYYTKPEMELTL